MIVVLHGRDGNGIESTTCQKVREHFSDEVVVCPSYESTQSHSEIAKHLETIVECLKDENEELIFVGCSMGGYWARYLANKFAADKLVMLNPSLELYEEGIKVDAPHIQITVIVGLQDEVVNPHFAMNHYKERAEVFVFPNGDHRLHEQFPSILPKIEKVINNCIQ